MLRVALTHDVDRVNKSYQYITYTLRNLLNFKFNDLKYHILSIFKEEPYWNFPEIIRIENFQRNLDNLNISRWTKKDFYNYWKYDKFIS